MAPVHCTYISNPMFHVKFICYCRENYGTVFQQEKRSPAQEEVSCKKFKEEPLEENTTSKNQALALNLAARFLTARAQLIHQQVFLQQKAALGLWPSSASSVTPSSEDTQQKLSQMLQIAQFQAYLASASTSANKTENESREDLQQ